MPLELPNLDDRTYEDLVEEALHLIPTFAPEWTNYNPSDPGITLIELFAYLSEMLIYRLNRVTNANKQAFLNLISGLTEKGEKKYPTPLDEETLNEEIRKAIQALRKSDRAVTCQDFEQLSLAADPQVGRARCVARRNLKAENLLLSPKDQPERPGHVSVVILPETTPYLFQSDENEEFVNIDSTVDLLPSVDHVLYIGSADATFRSILFRFKATGEEYSLRYEYSQANAEWEELSNASHNLVDGTQNWAASGTVQFTPPSDWMPTSINGFDGYWIRISTISTMPPTSQKAKVSELFLSGFWPGNKLLKTILDYLDERRLLTTRVHAVGPQYLSLSLKITLMLKPDAPENEVLEQVVKTLWKFFDPLTGGTDGRGWKFGRDIYVSEVYQLLDNLAGVDYVIETEFLPIDTNREVYHQNQLTAVEVYPNELVNAQINATDIELLTPIEPWSAESGGGE